MTINCNVLVACNSEQKQILEQEFPNIGYQTLTGYAISYGRHRLLTRLAIIFQIPKILIKINREKAWLAHFARQQQPDLIISDNRYGFYHPNIPSVFITHQLAIPSGMGKWADRILQRLNYSFINRFRYCWVPDLATTVSLAGKLSHPGVLPRTPLCYLGPLSRLQACPPATTLESIDLLIVLSGPEPQRSILERLLLKGPGLPGLSVVLVRGLTGNPPLPPEKKGLTVFNYLNSTLLNQYVCQAKFVLARSGYSSVMDYLKLRKKTILIPTPGQTEQEYLGLQLQQQQLALVLPQKNFNIALAFGQARQFAYRQPELSSESYKEIITALINELPA